MEGVRDSSHIMARCSASLVCRLAASAWGPEPRDLHCGALLFWSRASCQRIYDAGKQSNEQPSRVHTVGLGLAGKAPRPQQLPWLPARQRPSAEHRILYWRIRVTTRTAIQEGEAASSACQRADACVCSATLLCGGCMTRVNADKHMAQAAKSPPGVLRRRWQHALMAPKEGGGGHGVI